MAKTPLMQALVELMGLHGQAQASGIPVDELQDIREASRQARATSGLTRRQLLKGAGAVAVGMMLPPLVHRASAATPRIAIVGGGMAGLTAAMTLKDAGWASTIYEASESSIGGRMQTDRGTSASCGNCHDLPSGAGAGIAWANGQTVDVFGELIDTDHTTMRSLAQRFGLGLTDLLAAQPSGSTDTYYFLNKHYTVSQANKDFAIIYKALQADLRSAGYPTTYNSSTSGGRALDNMSIYQWIESRVPGGHSSPLGRLIDVAYVIEYGADTNVQSALNMLYLLGYSSSKTLQIYGESDERFRITGGVDQLPKAIASYVSSSIQLDRHLEALIKNSDGTYTLEFAGTSFSTVADLVILAVPFTALRSVDLSRAGFDSLKMEAINQQGAAHNGKLQLQFTTRHWTSSGVWGKGNGNTYADTGYQATWEATRGQSGTTGILVDYTGGSVADAMRVRHPYAVSTKSADVVSDAQTFLSRIEPVFPGITAKWNGKAVHSMAHLNPRMGGAYPYYKVGQTQRICGYEQVRQGNCFFAGDHTSIDYLGYMEGAASEGVRVGQELLALL